MLHASHHHHGTGSRVARSYGSDPHDPFTAIGGRIAPQPGGCWTYNGKTDTYGQVKVDGKQYPAHRWVYEVLVGPVPEGHVLHHECQVKACVNPDHLTPMTNVDHLALHRELAAR